MAELTKTASDRIWFNPQDVDYPTLNALASASFGTNNSAVYIGQRNYVLLEREYNIHRVGLIFDTSSIPASANISSVVLQIYVNTISTTIAFDVVIQNGQPTYPHDPPEQGDFYRGNYSGNGGSINTDDLSIDEYNDITLNTSWVTKAGQTKLMLRSSRDISASAPAEDAYNWISIGGKTDKPKLVITYTTIPVVTTQATTEISYQCAMGNGTIVSGVDITERGFEIVISFAGTLGNYVFHHVAGFNIGTVTYSATSGYWEGTLTKTESETGSYGTGAYELVLGYPSVLGNPSSVFNDKLFKCESYTYRAYATNSVGTGYGSYVAFNTLCDDGGDQETDDDISDGDPTVPIIPIDPDIDPYPPFPGIDPEEPDPYPPFPEIPYPDWDPDYPPWDWVGDFYYRKPYTKKDLDELRKKCIIYNKNSIEFALVLRHNMNVLKEFFNMMTDYMSKEEFNDFTDLIPPQNLKELYLDPLDPTDFRDMINGFIRNTIDNNIAVNRNFSLIQSGLSEYETESDDAYFREITSSIKSVAEDNPDVHRLKRKIDSLNREVAFNFGNIMHNLKIIRARLL